MGAIWDTFKKLAQGLFAIGTLTLGPVGAAIGSGFLFAAHAVSGVYNAYRKNFENAGKELANTLTLGFNYTSIASKIVGYLTRYLGYVGSYLGTVAYGLYYLVSSGLTIYNDRTV